MTKTKPSISRSFAYGITFLSTATSPGIAWPDVPVQSSTPSNSSNSTAVESRHLVLRDRASTIDQLLALHANSGTGGCESHVRASFEAASEIPAVRHNLPASLDTADAVASIRAALSLQVKELATVLGVTRPTIYTWLRNDEKPQSHNRRRISQLHKFAKTWDSMSSKPVGAAVRNEIGIDGNSLVDMLANEQLDEADIILRMQKLAEARSNKSRGIHEIVKRHGIDLTKVRESQAEIDVLTGKPFRED